MISIDTLNKEIIKTLISNRLKSELKAFRVSVTSIDIHYVSKMLLIIYKADIFQTTSRFGGGRRDSGIVYWSEIENDYHNSISYFRNLKIDNITDEE